VNAVSVSESTITKATHPSLSLAYDLALKTYDYADRRFDLLGTRAAAIIGFTSILVASASSVIPRLRPYRELQVFGAIVFLGIIAYVLYHGVLAYKGRKVKALPDPSVLFAKCAPLTEDEFRVELMGQLTYACQDYSAACTHRSDHLQKALYAFVVASGILLPALVFVP
jgi:hypothetical protein